MPSSLSSLLKPGKSLLELYSYWSPSDTGETGGVCLFSTPSSRQLPEGKSDSSYTTMFSTGINVRKFIGVVEVGYELHTACIQLKKPAIGSWTSAVLFENPVDEVQSMWRTRVRNTHGTYSAQASRWSSACCCLTGRNTIFIPAGRCASGPVRKRTRPSAMRLAVVYRFVR